MTAPVKIWADEYSNANWSRGYWGDRKLSLRDGVEYIRADLITAKDAEIARLQMALAETEALELQHGAVVERLQARLAACPTAEQLRGWAADEHNGFLRLKMTQTANRMDEANAK